jgi:tape measure domain-containing protein
MAMDRFRNSTIGVVRALTSTRGLLMSFATGFGGFRLAESFIEANSSLEKMTIQLAAMTGGAEKGKEAFKWIQDFQLKNPIADLETLTNSFIGLVSAGINPTTGAMKGLLGAMAKYQLSSDSMKRIIIAVRQQTSIDNAQKQEINQLAEQIPRIGRLIAAEMGTTTQQLFKDVTDMKVDSLKMAGAFLRALEKDGASIIKEMEGTWQAGIERLKTAWFNLMTTLGNTGLFDKLKNIINQVTVFINTNQALIIEYANNIIGAIASIYDEFNELGKSMFGDQGFLGAAFKSLNWLVTNIRIGVLTIKTAFKEVFDDAEKSSFFIQTKIARMGAYTGMKGPYEKATDDIVKLNEQYAKSLDYEKKLADMETNRTGWTPDVDIMDAVRNNPNAPSGEILKKIQMVEKDLAKMNAWIKGDKYMSENVASYVDEVMDIVKKSDAANTKWNAAARKWKELTSKPLTAGDLKDPDQMGIPGTFDPFAPLRTYAQVTLSDYEPPTIYGASQNNFLFGMQTQLDEMTNKFDEAYGTWEKKGMEFAEITARSMGDAFDTFFFDVLEGNLRKATDYFNEFFKSIAKSIAQIVNQQIAMGIVSGIVGQFGGSITGTTRIVPGGGQFQQMPGTPAPMGGNTMMAKPMQVNIINESGQPVRAKSATASQSASGMALNLVIDGLSRNENGSRDAMRAMLA